VDELCNSFAEAGGFDRSPGDAQCGVSRINVLVPECQHIQGPKMGAGPGDAGGRPAAFEQVCVRLCPRPTTER